MKLLPSEAKILQALRAGALDPHVLRERFGDTYSNAVSRLRKLKLAESVSDVAIKITPLGLALCPKRREVKTQKVAA